MISKDWPNSLIEAVCVLMKEKRLELGASIYGVSHASGVDEQVISNYEKLKHSPSLEGLVKVSGALGLSPSELLALAQARVGELPQVQIAAPSRASKRRAPKDQPGKP